MNWILASQSPRRQELLKLIQPDFEVRVANIKEVIDPLNQPGVAVMALAFQKAFEVAKTCEENDIVIGSDTVVYHKGFLGKPETEDDARKMLMHLSGSKHHVYTGYCVLQAKTDLKIIDYVKTVVEMKHLTPLEIEQYIASGEPMDKAGAYGIQGLGARFIKRVEGDYYTVMGLPVNKLYETLVTHFDL